MKVIVVTVHILSYYTAREWILLVFHLFFDMKWRIVFADTLGSEGLICNKY